VVSLYGNRPRYKTPDQVVEELETIYNAGWRRDVFFCDDNFIANKSRAREILDRVTRWNQRRGEPFRFWTQVSVNLGQDIDLIDRMTEANFSTVFVGIETPDDSILKRTRKFQNVHNPLVESLNNIKRNGLSVAGSFVVGFDGETEATSDRISELVEATDLPVFQLLVLQAPPHTNLSRRLQKEGRLLRESMATDWVMMRPNFVPQRPEIEILEDFARLWDHLYEPSRFLRRTYNYYRAMRPTRAAMGQKADHSPRETITSLNRPWKDFLCEIRAFFRLAWSQGVRLPCRFQFWRQLFGIRYKNPSRLIKYVQTCALGQDMFRIRAIIAERFRDLREHLHHEPRDVNRSGNFKPKNHTPAQ